MEKTLVASHVIHLAEAERYVLQNKSVDTTGVSTEVNVIDNKTTDEPAKEIFTRYIIKIGESTIITDEDDHYQITITRKQYKNKIAEGIGHLSFTTKGKAKIDDTDYICLHQVVISTRELLERSLYFSHLDQMGCK